jgi:hypothetical protein
MLQITIPEQELFNDKTGEFTKTKQYVLTLQHSLVSVSKWESKWQTPFLTKEEKSVEETVDYIRCMTITQNVDPIAYNFITNDIIKEVNDYIESPMTATTFSKDRNHIINREIITSEIIYYWMVALTIPFECEKWHLNRLLTLINVCNIKNQPKKKIGRAELLARQRNLNAARRSKLNSTG